MARGLPVISHVGQFCDTCVITKHRRAPFPSEAQYRAQDPLELVHGDLYGPIAPTTPGGRRFFLLLVDDATRYMWVALLTTKGAAADAIKHLQAAAEKKSGKKLRTLRTDNGREFTVAEFAAYCAKEGIQRHYSAPYTPQQNGVVERHNQTVVAMARALLKQRGLPARFWDEAVVTAVHLLNRAPTKALNGVTPYEAWHGKAPEVGYLRTFGCVAFTKDLSQLKKLDDRRIPGIFIGYADGAKAYRIFDPAAQRVRVSRDVVFDESRRWDWIKDGGEQAPAEEEFAVEHAWEEGIEGARTPTPVSPISSPSPVPSAPHSPSPAPGEQGSPGTEDSTPLFQEETTPAAPIPTPAPEIEHATPLEDDEGRLDASYDDEPLRYRTMENILGDDSPPG